MLYSRRMLPKTWITTWWRSLTQPHYYLELLRLPLSFTLRFMGVACLLLGWWLAIVFIQVDLPKLSATITEATQELSARYPSDLVISWDGSTFSYHTTSITTPYLAVPWPASLTHLSGNDLKIPSHLAYLTNQSLSQAPSSDTFPTASLAVITPHTIWMSNQEGAWSSTPLADLLSFDNPVQLTASSLSDFIQAILSFWEVAKVGISLAIFIIFPVAIAILIIGNSILDSLMIWLLSRALGLELSWSKVWQLMLHWALIGQFAHQLATLLMPGLEFNVASTIVWSYAALTLLRNYSELTQANLSK